MKIYTHQLKKIFTSIFLLFVLIATTNITYAAGEDIPFLSLIFGTDKAAEINQQVSNVKSYITSAQTVYNTYQTSKATIQNIKNFDLSNLAQNLGSDQILNYGNTILGVAKGDQGVGINVNTGGNQVVTNLQNYLDKIGVNEIKKMVNDIKDPVNTTPYSADIKDAISKFVQNTANTATGKVVNFTLPYIVKDEICNSPTLKDVIKNGEPSDYIKPKPAVGNVDIEVLCNTDLTDPQDGAAAQASFIALAKAGYGGDKTDIALSDPANTPSGVVDSALAILKEKKAAAEDAASKQVTATGLNIGQQVCFDKNGKKVDYDPTATSSADRMCYSQNSSVDQSGSVLKDRAAAALLAPYFSMLARAQATSNKLGSCSPSLSNSAKAAGGADTKTNLAPSGKDMKSGLPTTAPTDVKRPTPTSFINKGNSIATYQNKSILEKIFGNFFEKALAVDVKTAGTINQASGCISAASNIMNTLSTVINMGTSNYEKTISGIDNPYSRLADQLSGITTSQYAQNNLYTSAEEANKNYQLGTQENEYTIDDLKQRLDLYKDIRDFNTKRLNDHVYTYVLLKIAVMNGRDAVRNTTSDAANTTIKSFLQYGPAVMIFRGSKARSSMTIAQNTAKASNELKKAIINESIATRALIKEMAVNNYKEQQMKKLMDQFQNTDSSPEDNAAALTSALSGTLTLNDYADIQNNWQYTPRYQDSTNDPTTPLDVSGLNEKQALKEQARQSERLVPPKDEVQGPYTEQNLFYLRVRAYKVFKLSGATSFADSDKTLLGLFNITSADNLSPETPRTSRATGLVDSNSSKNYSELGFCNKTGMSSYICDTKYLTGMISNISSSMVDPNSSLSDTLDNYCANIQSSLEKDCQNQSSSSELYQVCTDQTAKENFINNATEFCNN